MPVYVIKRTTEYEARIEAPNGAAALAEVEQWDRGDWGHCWDDIELSCVAPEGTRPDYVVQE